MGLLDEIDFESIKTAYHADLPTPVDVLNLIHFKDEEAYKWYGVSVMPLLRVAGGKVGWMGKHVDSLLGDSRAEELLVVRYPNQKRFFGLVLNPYYFFVANPQRLKGVRRFEASFTHSPDSLDPLRRSEWVLAVHLKDGVDPVRRIVEQAGGSLVYRSAETSPIKITKRDHPANSNPLVYGQTAMFRFDSDTSCRCAMSAEVLSSLRGAAGDLSVQLYQRVPRSEAVPAALARLLG